MTPKPLAIVPRPKPERLPKKVYMTIAAGFNCSDGVVLCADTQETRRQILKVRVPKLVRRPELDYENSDRKALFSGAGEGPFIDKLINRAWKAALHADADIGTVADAMEESIKNTHQEYAGIYQPGYLPEVQLIYGLWVKGYPTRLFASVGPVVNPVESHECVGIGEVLARFIADRMFVPGITTSRMAEILSVYLLEQCKDYVDGCGGESVVAILKGDGTLKALQFADVQYIMLILGQLDAYAGSILLRGADPDISDEEFENVMKTSLAMVKHTRRMNAALQQKVEDAHSEAKQSASQKLEPEQ